MHDPLPKADLHIISGGPGSGKSTLLQCLKEKGYTAMPEAGRSIIRQQMAQWGQALPWADRAAYARLMLAWELKALDQARQLSGPVFFDRGLPDIMGYLKLCGLLQPPELIKACEANRYGPVVFMAPPWRKIYASQGERRQDWAEAVDTYEVMVEVYTSLNYELIPLPFASPAERAEFVLEHISV